MTDTPSAPDDLRDRGRAIWASVADDFDLNDHERALLHEAARVADRLDSLDEVVRREGVTISSPQGVKAHPALTEARQQGITFSRLIAALRIPDEDDARPQRRGGARGHYASRKYGVRSVGIR